MVVKKKKKAKKTGVVRGKRKEATARAKVTPGTGRIYFNGSGLNALSSPYVRLVIQEPLRYVDASKYDVFLNVQGGGVMGQAQAARVAIANALVQEEGDALKEKMMKEDRSLLVEDSRRVEPKKFRGPKARARFTKSYR
ncbi:30S ribosomal protein S9 [Candidatus Micrarchaeota archaeon]|nr:30S ribosomal protein S9 [Candidatus Micrarchaeota archaeon]